MGLTQGFNNALEPLITQSQLNLLTLLTIWLKHPQAPVQQSTYALVGDMAMGCFTVLRPYMAGIMAKLILQLEVEPKIEIFSPSRNVAWSVGEVALRYGQDDPEFQKMGESSHFAINPYPPSPQSTSKLAYKCGCVNRQDWSHAPQS
ncbi:hypothetical protein BT96DRAFT_932291 [Gymnopus androsaceus JB14]|uniref:Uncharacterized protein n=1 Tax=Gymnopus androsaceus JB14 TaxID=1447944 RepID=A0A6A4IEK2_9AGAR|nr:hypothetical protein BT96DRAFT_932291 [Gymnopus androsaceus JB14]